MSGTTLALAGAGGDITLSLGTAQWWVHQLLRAGTYSCPPCECICWGSDQIPTLINEEDIPSFEPEEDLPICLEADAPN